MTRLARGGALLAAIAVALAGCGGADPRPGQAPGESVAGVAPEPSSGATGSAAGPSGEPGGLGAGGAEGRTRSAFFAAAEYLRLDRAEAGKTSLVVRSPAEGGATATAVAMLDGLLDDSVGALRITLELERREDGTWGVVSESREQRCRPGRGHQDFDRGPCV